MRRITRVLTTLGLGIVCAGPALAQKHPAGEITLDIKPDRITIESNATARRGKVEVVVLARFVPGAPEQQRGSVVPRRTHKGAVPNRIRLNDGTLQLYKRVTIDGKVVHASGDKALYKELIARAKKLLGPERLKSLKSWGELVRRAGAGQGRLNKLWRGKRPGGSREPGKIERPTSLEELGLALSHSHSARANPRMRAELTQLVFVIDDRKGGGGGSASSSGTAKNAAPGVLSDRCTVTLGRGRDK